MLLVDYTDDVMTVCLVFSVNRAVLGRGSSQHVRLTSAATQCHQLRDDSSTSHTTSRRRLRTTHETKRTVTQSADIINTYLLTYVLILYNNDFHFSLIRFCAIPNTIILITQ